MPHQPPCTDAKMLLGQDAEEFPSQPLPRTAWCHGHTTVGIYQKCSLCGDCIVFLLFPFSKNLGPSLWPRMWGLACSSTSQEQQRPCCPCSRAFLSSVATNPQSRVVINTESVWGVKHPLLCFNDSPNTALIWRCQFADCLCGTN